MMEDCGGLFRLDLEFVVFRLNSGCDCIHCAGWNPNMTTTARCLSVQGNVCPPQSYYRYLGIFYTEAQLIVCDSVIEGNTWPYFVEGTNSVTVTLYNCYLDSFVLNTTGSMKLVTTDCLTDASNVSWVPACFLGTRTTPRTPDPSPVPAADDGANAAKAAVVASIVAGVVVVILATVAGVFLVCRRRSRGFNDAIGTQALVE
jgi:hypothetical protein